MTDPVLIYRPFRSQTAVECRIVCALPIGRFLVEEVGPVLAGRWLADRADLYQPGAVLTVPGR
jgi:hypothetical protein